ncbi:MAG: glycoside hydrolase family 127 protein [Bacteroidales bacterium]|nr:glycoside hydrolase family 127 protein [Bacteroidales bacterium]
MPRATRRFYIGLVKLYRLTGDRRWLELAQFFLDVRGRPGNYVRHPQGSRFEVYNDSVYLQMHKPLVEQTEAVGHAVRGGYMYTVTWAHCRTIRN